MKPSWHSFTINNKVIFIIMAVIIVTSLYDVLLAKLYRYVQVFSVSNFEESVKWNTLSFVLLAITYAVSQSLVLRYMNNINEPKLLIHLSLSILQKVVMIAQWISVIFLTALILQMLITSSYSVFILFVVTGISYSIAIVSLGLLAERFFSWFRSNRSLIVLSYAFAAMILSINAGFTLAYVGDLFKGQSTIVEPHIIHISSPPSANLVLSLGYVTTSVVSFLSIWIATVFLLRDHSRRLGKAVYWVIVSIPLAYFLGQFPFLFLALFQSYFISNPVTIGIIYSLVLSLSKPVGGVLFGIAFWAIAKNIQRSRVKDYLIISAYGFVLLFTSDQAIVLVNYDYPPFGLATVSYFGLSSYLVLTGIYYAAISVAQDQKLRRSIKRITVEEAKMLERIGSAQMEQQVVKKVLTISKATQREIEEVAGFDTSLKDEDVAKYIEEVLKEVKQDKNAS